MTTIPEKYADIPGVFSYTLGGRLMWFKLPSTGQLILLQRFRMQLKGVDADEAGHALMMSVSMKTLNVIDSLFLDLSDRDFVEDLLIAGKIEINDVMPILAGGSKDDTSDDDIAPVKKAVKKTAKTAPRRASK